MHVLTNGRMLFPLKKLTLKVYTQATYIMIEQYQTLLSETIRLFAGDKADRRGRADPSAKRAGYELVLFPW